MKRNTFIFSIITGMLLLFPACSKGDEIHLPDIQEPVINLPELPEPGDIHIYNAPLYCSVYEYCFELEKKGVSSSEMDITPSNWDKIIDWVSDEFAPYGYEMICTDGFIPMNANDASGYMTHYGSTALKDLVAKCKAKGLKLGVYDNPLWIHGNDATKIEGTNYTFGDLHYKGLSPVKHPSTNDLWFSWVAVENPGAREYIDNFFKHYAELDIHFIRMDFLSWFEDGTDRGMGIVGKGYGRESYERALAYIAQSAKKYNIFTSLVMPHLYNDASLEAKYGNMYRVVADTGDGGWSQCSAKDRGKTYSTWPNCNNMFDGFVYWSHKAGRKNVILDGDFIRLNKFDTDEEKQSVISLQLMAGGPIAIADQYDTIGEDVKYYTNYELLALNKDGFVGKPLSDSLNDPNNQIWYGEMSNHDVIVALFNRDDTQKTKSVKLSDLGITGEWNAYDLWAHQPEEVITEEISCALPPHGCKILRLTKIVES